MTTKMILKELREIKAMLQKSAGQDDAPALDAGTVEACAKACERLAELYRADRDDPSQKFMEEIHDCYYMAASRCASDIRAFLNAATTKGWDGKAKILEMAQLAQKNCPRCGGAGHLFDADTYSASCPDCEVFFRIECALKGGGGKVAG